MAKFMTAPFDFEKAQELEKAHPGEYVKTVSGENVQVLTFERSEDMPIVALVGVKKTIVCYDKYGCEISGSTSTHDLCLKTDEPAPDPRVQFEQELQFMVDYAVKYAKPTTDVVNMFSDDILRYARRVVLEEQQNLRE